LRACSQRCSPDRAGRQRSQGPASRPRQRCAYTTAAQRRGAGAVTCKYSFALARERRRRACLPVPLEPPGGPRPAIRSAPGRRLVIHIQARAARVAARHGRRAAAAEVRRRLILLGRCRPTALPSLRSWAIRTGQRPMPALFAGATAQPGCTCKQHTQPGVLLVGKSWRTQQPRAHTEHRRMQAIWAAEWGQLHRVGEGRSSTAQVSTARAAPRTPLCFRAHS